MKIYGDFDAAIRGCRVALLERGVMVHSKFWQGMDISSKKEAEMLELLNYSFQAPMNGITPSTLRAEVQPNLPWADLHFEKERVGGQPLNPGETWKIWPWGNSADKHRTQGDQFNHTYAERFWPKYAGLTVGGKLGFNDEEHPWKESRARDNEAHAGIRYRYADLDDVIKQLLIDPLTRQAYIPIWFPEDGSHQDRKPCTLGYHVIRRSNFLHMVYYIRSCDIVRHFQDDVYLAVRLLLWILDRLKNLEPENWNSVLPGMYTMHITSLHCFVGDRRHLEKLADRG